MSVDIDAVRASVQAARKHDVREKRVFESLDFDAMTDALDPLVEAEGLDAVIDALAPHRSDLDVAEALFHLCWTNDRNMLSVFSEDEVVDAAMQQLLTFGVSEPTDTRAVPEWGWSALLLHQYECEEFLTNEQAFRILIAVVDRAPWDDKILEALGDSPLRNPRADPEYGKRLDELAKTEPKITRAIELDAAYWAELDEPTFTVDGKQYTADEFLHRFPIKDFPIEKHLDGSTDP